MIFSTVAGVMVLYVTGMRNLQKRIQKHQAAAASCITESFLGIRTIHSFGAEKQLVQRYAEARPHVPAYKLRLLDMSAKLLTVAFANSQLNEAPVTLERYQHRAAVLPPSPRACCAVQSLTAHLPPLAG